MVNINPNEPKEENYIHDPVDPMDSQFCPPWWLGCMAITTIILLFLTVIYLMIKYGG